MEVVRNYSFDGSAIVMVLGNRSKISYSDKATKICINHA